MQQLRYLECKVYIQRSLQTYNDRVAARAVDRDVALCRRLQWWLTCQAVVGQREDVAKSRSDENCVVDLLTTAPHVRTLDRHRKPVG